ETFHDPGEEPYLKLLSVETRYRDESISQLKNMPVEWSKVRLNTNSAADMKKALKALADTKRVYALEARMLGLAPMLNENGELPGEEELVEVPAWRYALINYPHPLLTNGLSILDTPGLNALGMEPELTVSTVPNAHAIIFLLSIDTGVTKSDLEIWERYVRAGLPQKIAVLNKVDLMWDELKAPAEIDKAIARMVDTTAQHLHIPKERIFPISAQKALQGKSREVVTKLWGRITAEKNAYNAALAEYKVNHGQFSVKKAALVDLLNPARMDAMLAANAEAMEGSWVTMALQKSMRDLTRE